jgi:hypothetical protein
VARHVGWMMVEAETRPVVTLDPQAMPRAKPPVVGPHLVPERRSQVVDDAKARLMYDAIARALDPVGPLAFLSRPRKNGLSIPRCASQRVARPARLLLAGRRQGVGRDRQPDGAGVPEADASPADERGWESSEWRADTGDAVDIACRAGSQGSVDAAPRMISETSEA